MFDPKITLRTGTYSQLLNINLISINLNINIISNFLFLLIPFKMTESKLSLFD